MEKRFHFVHRGFSEFRHFLQSLKDTRLFQRTAPDRKTLISLQAHSRASTFHSYGRPREIHSLTQHVSGFIVFLRGFSGRHGRLGGAGRRRARDTVRGSDREDRGEAGVLQRPAGSVQTRVPSTGGQLGADELLRTTEDRGV